MVASKVAGSPKVPLGELVWSPPRSRLLLGLAVGALGPVVLALVLVPLRGQLDGGTVGLVLLVPTAVAAALGGPLPAAVAVLVGATTHNVLFTVPLLTLRVSEATELAGLAVHTVVAVTVSYVVVREQRAARLAAQRQGAADQLAVLEEVDRARIALLGAVSHDLRTPLSAIAAAASDLRDDEVRFSEEQQQVLLATIGERAEVLDRTVGQLLDASRLQAGATTVVAEAVEVADLVEEAVIAVGPDARERVHLRVDPGTPPVLVDPVLIVATLRNLLENALRHGPEGTPVVVDAARADQVVVLSVSDEGPGLRGAGEEAFAAFNGSSGGPGLGLTIARGFVELHGGRLDEHDGPTGGAVFEFTLPATEVPEP